MTIRKKKTRGIIAFQVRPEEKQLALRAAERERVSLSDMLRRWVLPHIEAERSRRN